jgi:hypothetical protein
MKIVIKTPAGNIGTVVIVDAAAKQVRGPVA